MRKIDAGTLQDMHHYCLAMMGQEGAFNYGYLSQRLDAADNLYRLCTTIEESDPNCGAFDHLDRRSLNNDFSSEAEMVKAGETVLAIVLALGEKLGIDTYSGEKALRFTFHKEEVKAGEEQTRLDALVKALKDRRPDTREEAADIVRKYGFLPFVGGRHVAIHRHAIADNHNTPRLGMVVNPAASDWM